MPKHAWLTILWMLPVGLSAAYAELRYRVEYATFFGGSAYEQIREIIVYPDGSVLVGGQTASDDLPVTGGVLQTRYGGEPPGRGHPGVSGGDCFLARISPIAK